MTKRQKAWAELILVSVVAIGLLFSYLWAINAVYEVLGFGEWSVIISPLVAYFIAIATWRDYESKGLE